MDARLAPARITDNLLRTSSLGFTTAMASISFIICALSFSIFSSSLPRRSLSLSSSSSTPPFWPLILFLSKLSCSSNRSIPASSLSMSYIRCSCSLNLVLNSMVRFSISVSSRLLTSIREFTSPSISSYFSEYVPTSAVSSLTSFSDCSRCVRSASMSPSIFSTCFSSFCFRTRNFLRPKPRSSFLSFATSRSVSLIRRRYPSTIRISRI
mmetsp:Transcript_318/g.885  ORF Transcript_318/g.885 Transcript_318/m.885 type:complete len:210 (-) Transcript_318:121-750(-)